MVDDICTKGKKVTTKELLENSEYLTYADARKAGLSKYRFYKFIRENECSKVGHGEYALGDTLPDSLYVMHMRCPSAVFSHDEAFYYHGLSDREPLACTLTVYSGYNPHRLISNGECKVYMIKKELLDVGKTMVKDNFGNTVPMYDLERTICDLIRSRNSIEVQEFNTVLKSYVARKDKDLNRLMEYAVLFGIQNVLRRYMEVLL